MKSDKAQIQRLHTGVPGLDEVLGGGLPEFSFNVIAGPPGSGKTTLAHQIMFAMATPERPALYVSLLGEPPLKILRYQQQFDFFDLDQLNRSIRIINLADEAASGDLKKVLARLSAEVEQHQPGLVFVDSFSSIVLTRSQGGQNGLSVQHLLQQLSVLLISWQATTFLIGEYFHVSEPDPIFTAADGLIWLRQSVQGNSMVRKMQVVKMRGQATVPGLHTFRMSQSGIQVFAPAAQALPIAMRPASPGSDRLSMGVDGLDEMMGGGLPRGYSLLVAGPSGSGKSILASAFLIEGARQGEKGVIAAFEQRSHSSRGPAIAGLIDSGQLGVVDTRIVGLSVDEMAMLLVAEIRRLDARRVVLDSLSGFELALAPTFREDFRESLSRLVGALAATGATVLMTSELEDRYTDLRFSPYGTAFLTDAIIVQRYVEIDSRLERMMAVVRSARARTPTPCAGSGSTARASTWTTRWSPMRACLAAIRAARAAKRCHRREPGRPSGGPAAGRALDPADAEQPVCSAARGTAPPPGRVAAHPAAGRRRPRFQLQKANEHLLMASLNADQVAQSALAEVDLLLRRTQLDVLTETPNRSLLLDRLRVAIAHARRDGRRVAVLFIDLDHFKEINDTLGHAMGDEVLRRVARCLEGQLRETDTVSRHGGDEFLVVLADLEDPAGIRPTADKLLAALASPCEIAGHPMTLSASMGVAVYPEDGDEAAVLIHAADTAMYLAKRQRHLADPAAP